MKKIISIIILVLCARLALSAQTQTLELVYITKDYTTEVGPLCRELMDIYKSAEKDKSQAVIFYLANSTSPLIVKVNLPGDNRDKINNIMDALISKSETVVNPMSDLRRFIDIFNQHEIITASGEPLFQSVDINYYVTPTFWELQYNEQLIAAAYFALGMDSSWADGYFSMSIYHNGDDGLVVDEKHPFGIRNLCKNYKFFLLTYSN